MQIILFLSHLFISHYFVFLPIDQVKTYSNKLDMNAEGKSFLALSLSTKKSCTGRSQDGGGTGRGDHLLPHKFIKRTFRRWANCTKQLLIASRGHQEPRKAAHCLRKEAGKDINDKKRDKRARDGDLSWEGSHNRGSFRTPGKPRTGGSGGSFRISEGNLTGKKNK